MVTTSLSWTGSALCSAALQFTPLQSERLSPCQPLINYFSAFTSVIRTLARNVGDHSLVNGLCGVFSGAPVPTPSF